MDDLLKGLAGGGQGQQSSGSSGGGGIGDLLGGLLGGGGIGSALGAGMGAGVGNAMGGGMGSVLGGGLGALLPALLPAVLGMLGGKSGASGQSGVHQLVDTMHAQGMGDVASSWVGTGANQPITAAQVEQLLTPEQLAQLAADSGLPPEQVSQGVAAVLPDVVNTLTPDGSLPDHAQVQATADQLRGALAGLGGGQP
jgi:uncharacterized protein YidB (DUF937 family)